VDNVTHALIGYALGRAYNAAGGPHERAGSRATPHERSGIAVGVLASNVPDLDFVTSLFGSQRRLEYLLEHRGFTHTLLFATLLGVLVALSCGWVCGSLRAPLRTRRHVVSLIGLGCVSSWLHIGFDALNDYGVHPFYPFDLSWYYGDSVFIIEPLLFAVLLPLPLWFAHSRTGRVLSGLLALGLIVLVWIPGLVTWPSALLVTLVLVAVSVWQRRAGPGGGVALGLCAAVVALFAATSQLAEAQVGRALAAAAPAERVLDLASSPAPANPGCHRTLAVSIDGAGMYRARLIQSSLLGEHLASACRLLPSSPTAPLRPAASESASGVRFVSLFEAPVAELRALHASHCDARAMLRFVRVPFWLGAERVLGDLRYDRDPSLEFAERALDGACVDSAAPWTPPRADLLRGSAAAVRE
jgi:inner membrane protein